ncbi:MAG: hypothetical protein WC707_04745 [Candidatus Babeliaceae bacterium]|jgi:hypothetical protein
MKYLNIKLLLLAVVVVLNTSAMNNNSEILARMKAKTKSEAESNAAALEVARVARLKVLQEVAKAEAEAKKKAEAEAKKQVEKKQAVSPDVKPTASSAEVKNQVETYSSAAEAAKAAKARVLQEIAKKEAEAKIKAENDAKEQAKKAQAINPDVKQTSDHVAIKPVIPLVGKIDMAVWSKGGRPIAAHGVYEILANAQNPAPARAVIVSQPSLFSIIQPTIETCKKIVTETTEIVYGYFFKNQDTIAEQNKETKPAVQDELQEHQAILCKVADDIGKADKICQALPIDNSDVQFLDHVQNATYSDIGLIQDAEVERFAPDFPRAIEGTRGHALHAHTDELVSLNDKFDKYKEKAQKNAPYQIKLFGQRLELIEGTLSATGHLIRSGASPEIRDIPEYFNTLKKPNLSHYFYFSPSFRDPSLVDNVKNLLGSKAHEHFIINEIENIHKEILVLRDKKIEIKPSLYQINAFKENFLLQLASNDKIAIFNNLLLAREFQKFDVLPAIENKLMALHNEAQILQQKKKGENLADDLVNDYKLENIHKQYLETGLIYAQAVQRLTFYEECAKLTLQDIKIDQATTGKYMSYALIATTLGAGAAKNLIASGKQLQDKVDSWIGQERGREIYEMRDRNAEREIVNISNNNISSSSATSVQVPAYNKDVRQEMLQAAQQKLAEMFPNKYVLHQESSEIKQHFQSHEFSKGVEQECQKRFSAINMYVQLGHGAVLDGLDAESIKLAQVLQNHYSQGNKEAQREIELFLSALQEVVRGFSEEIGHQGIDTLKGLPTAVAVSCVVNVAASVIASPVATAIGMSLNGHAIITHGKDFIEDAIAIGYAVVDNNPYGAGRALATATVDGAKLLQAVNGFKELKKYHLSRSNPNKTGGSSRSKLGESETKNISQSRVDPNQKFTMKDFFNSDIGRELKKESIPTGYIYQGAQIYKVNGKPNNQYLNKGDQFYLDMLHRNHIEVFDKSGTAKCVLNMDGTLNGLKTGQIKGRKL